jgi:hypothetical protein
VFLVAAIKRLRALLPADWTAAERHAYLVERIAGAELDAFACEVATLSLILADYPNANGWKVQSRDLFEPGALADVLAGASVILCNPPFEDFTASERIGYPEAFATSASKASFALHTALNAEPAAIGFVLPRGFLLQQRYRELRARVGATYANVDLLSLPDRIFEKATYPCALLIASERRAPSPSAISRLVSGTVSERDRARFLNTGLVSSERTALRAAKGDLWIGELDEVWSYLARSPRLGAAAHVYRGLQWRVQGKGIHDAPGPQLAPGYFRPRDSLVSFRLSCPKWLSIDPNVNLRPAPLTRPWDQPKVLINNQRLSRGPWRLAAAADRSGMLASQQFTGVWPIDSYPLDSLAAVLNGPVVNAFVTEHSTDHDFTNDMLKRLPLPNALDHDALALAVARYVEVIDRWDGLDQSALSAELNRALVEIDALVLQGYDLPPRLEHRLLDFFAGAKRPTAHPFAGWIPPDVQTFTPLHEWLGRSQNTARGSWVLDVFKPIPATEADAIAHFID